MAQKSLIPVNGQERKTKSGQTAAALIPRQASLAELRTRAASCKACHLWKTGTQTVFGEGSRHAQVMFVGEQPGDKEDIAGRPFVGPAGALLDKVLEETGISRGEVYVTNVVKHFKWEPRGKRRIHKKPNAIEITACKPWLEAEIDRVRPQAIVLLGATAAQAILGRSFRVTVHRGELLESRLAPVVMATVHPSSILRAPDDESRRRERERFKQDIAALARNLEKKSAA